MAGWKKMNDKRKGNEKMRKFKCCDQGLIGVEKKPYKILLIQ